MNSENLVGSTLNGRYEIIEKIGSGGMASVFKAKDTLLNRYVAIKILRDALEGEKQVVSNFIKEAQSSASLSHNNVVSVFDVGEDNGINYMVMELVDGITLKEYIKENGALPWQEACDYAIQIAQGIGEAHAQNIIHRDIKPQNIIMTADKTLKVTDFGIARAMAADTTIVGGTALGSVHYISPEQARGGFTDARSDIYSLGIVLYEMLTGKVPFDGDTPVSVALMHLEREPVNVKCVNMNIPSDLAYVVMKAIAKEQSARYQNIPEMLNDLHAVLAEEPLPSRENERAGGVVHPSEADGGDTKVIPKLPDRDGDDYDYDYPEDVEDIDDEGLIAEKTGRRSKKRTKVRKQKTAAQKKEDRLAVVLALVTIAAILLIAFGAYKIISGTNGANVPDLTNKTVEEATQELQALELKVDDEIEYSLSDDIEEGRVITQDPEPGKFVGKNSSVKLVVSIGSSGGNIPVPNVVGRTFDEAISQVMAAGLTYRVVESPSDTVPQGNIIRQIPMAGTKVNENDIVTLHVSTGENVTATQAPATVQKVSVPNLIGMGREQAEIELNNNGLKLGTVTRKASGAPEGTIISQSPEASRTAARDSYVTIVLSSGNESSTQTTVTESAGEIETPDETTENTGGEEETPSYEEPGEEYIPEPTDVPESSMDDVTEDSGGGEVSVKTFTVKIPDSANDTVDVEIIANGQTVHSGTHSKSEQYVSVEIEGSGSVDVQAYIDGALAAQKELTF